jgi:hypothetical protein
VLLFSLYQKGGGAVYRYQGGESVRRTRVYEWARKPIECEEQAESVLAVGVLSIPSSLKHALDLDCCFGPPLFFFFFSLKVRSYADRSELDVVMAV